MKNISFSDIIYSSGNVFLPKWLRDILNIFIFKDNDFSFYINGWTIIHFLSGVFIGTIYLAMKYPINAYYYKLFIIHTLWELWQMLIGMAKPYRLTGDSNLIDIVVDTFAFMGGGVLVKQFHKLV